MQTEAPAQEKTPPVPGGATVVRIDRLLSPAAMFGKLTDLVPASHPLDHANMVELWNLALGSAVSAAIVGNHIEKCATRQWFFHFDSINAGFLAGGFYRTKHYPTQRALMRSLTQLLQGRHGLSRLHWYHVKAHMGPRVDRMAQALLLS